MKIALGPLLEEFILWDKQETALHIEFTNVLRIVVRRIIIFVRHPQHLYHNYQISAANKIDAQLEVATAIAEVSRTEEQSRYFRYRSEEMNRKKLDTSIKRRPRKKMLKLESGLLAKKR